LKKLKYCLLISVVSMVFAYTIIIVAGVGKSYLAFLPLFQLVALFCVFYIFYFNAKSLKAVELQRPVTFGDYIGEFFLLLFFPIGVWIIQPRINKIFEEKEEA